MKSQDSKPATDKRAGGHGNGFELETFLPYRLALLSSLVSRSIQKLYSREFDISIPEWRLIAILGSYGAMTANSMRDRSAMDKVQISRAVAKLADSGHIEKKIDPDDRRRTLLSLSASGIEIYNQIVPLALEREEFLNSALSKDELRDLEKLLEKLTKQAFHMTNMES